MTFVVSERFVESERAPLPADTSLRPVPSHAFGLAKLHRDGNDQPEIRSLGCLVERLQRAACQSSSSAL